MSEIVYDIQKPVGASERTVVGADIPNYTPDMLQLLDTGIKTAGKLGETLLSDKSKDNGPLVRALERFKNWSLSGKASEADMERRRDNLVEWAATNGWSYSDIKGYAEQIGANKVLDKVSEYQGRLADIQLSRQQAIREEALRKYPDMSPDEAIEKLLDDQADSAVVISGGQASMAASGETKESIFRGVESSMLREISNAYNSVYKNYGENFTTEIFDQTTEIIREDLVGKGYDDGMVNMTLQRLKPYWAPVVSSNDEDLLKTKNLVDARNDIITGKGQSEFLQRSFSFVDKKDGKTRYIRGMDIQAALNYLDKDTLSAIFTDLIDGSTAAGNTAILVALGAKEELQPLSTTDSAYLNRDISKLVSIQMSPQQKEAAIQTNRNAFAVLAEEGKLSPNAAMNLVMNTAETNRKLGRSFKDMSDDEVLENRDSSTKVLQNIAQESFKYFPNSMPLFDKKGQLHLYSVTENSYDAGYSVRDISNDSSLADTQYFSEFFDVPANNMIRDVSEITGFDEKTVKELFNQIMIQNSEVGNRIYNGMDTRSRRFGDFQQVYAGVNATPEAAEQIYEGIMEGSIKNWRVPKAMDFVYPAANRMRALEDDLSAIELFSTDKNNQDVRVFAPDTGKVYRVSDRSVKFVSEISGNIWEFTNIALHPSVKEGSYFRAGEEFAIKDPTVSEGLIVRGTNANGEPISVLYTQRKDILGSPKEYEPMQFSAGSQDFTDYTITTEEMSTEQGTQDQFKVIEDSTVTYNKDRSVTNEGPAKAEVKSPVQGEVLYAGSYSKGSSAVIIRDPDGYVWSIDGANLEPWVKTNASVVQGDIIANAGKSGTVRVEKRWPDKSGKPLFGLESKVSPQPTPKKPAERPMSVESISETVEVPAQVAPFVVDKLEEYSNHQLSRDEKERIAWKLKGMLEQNRERIYKARKERNRAAAESLAATITPFAGLELATYPALGNFLILLGMGSMGFHIGTALSPEPRENMDTTELANKAIQELLK